MKTFNTIRFILVAIIMITVYSCTNKTSTSICPTGETPFREAVKFTYDGHDYIRFSHTYDIQGLGVVHDPNCKCYKKEIY